MFKILHTPRYSSRLPEGIKTCSEPEFKFIGKKCKEKDLLFLKFSCIPLQREEGQDSVIVSVWTS